MHNEYFDRFFHRDQASNCILSHRFAFNDTNKDVFLCLA